MTDDQERALVAAFLMRGEEYSYGDTVDARRQADVGVVLGELLASGVIEYWGPDTQRLSDQRFKLTPGALQRFKGE